MNPNELNRLLLNLIRKGTVLAVDHANELCRVECGEIQTNWIHWISFAAGETRDWNPPTPGEQVLVLSPGGDMADAVALRGITTEDIPAPSHSPSTHTRAYPDGARIEYDHDAHSLTATLPAGATVLLQAPVSVTVKTANATVEADKVLVKSTEITLDAGKTTCTGSLDVKGDVTSGGDVKASGISLTKHTHADSGKGKPQ
jgi:phage baseplate assembly protein V